MLVARTHTHTNHMEIYSFPVILAGNLSDLYALLFCCCFNKVNQLKHAYHYNFLTRVCDSILLYNINKKKEMPLAWQAYNKKKMAQYVREYRK